MMKIASILNTHIPSKITLDTLDSIKTHLTKNVGLLIDYPQWNNFKYVCNDIPKFQGLQYRGRRGPYRNFAYGLQQIYEKFPDCDWYNYMEYDCLAVSSRIKVDLQNKREYDCLGFNYNRHRYDGWNLKMINSLLGSKLKEHHYCIGCCMFFNKRFINKIIEDDFFNRLIDETEYLKDRDFPDFGGYAFEEELYPSLAAHYGGKVGDLGKLPHYLVRWRPDIEKHEVPNSVKFLHPIKSYDNPIRQHYAQVRQRFK